MDDHEAAKYETRLEIVEGLIRAQGFGADLVDAVDASADRADALRRLAEPPFGFDAMVASYILDAPLGHRTKISIRALEEEAAALRAHLGR